MKQNEGMKVTFKSRNQLLDIIKNKNSVFCYKHTGVLFCVLSFCSIELVTFIR